MTPATMKTSVCRRRAKSRIGEYSRSAWRGSQGSSCCTFLNRKDDSTGMTVSDRMSELASANTIVIATGTKNLPSRPCSVIKGRNTTAMIRMPAATGAATSRTARNTTCWRGSLSLPSWARCWTMFSTTTTAPSTSMPSAIARPPRLIRLADMPYQRIRMKVASADSGSTAATVTAARRLPRKAPSSTSTSTVASSSALDTVPTAVSTRLARL